MAVRYESKLCTEAMSKAVAELNEPEDEAVRIASIEELRKRFQEEAKEFELIRSDDAFLLRFLRAVEYDQNRAFETLKNYHLKRKEARQIFNLVDDPVELSDFISTGAVLPLQEGRARDGTFVIIGRPGLGMVEKKDVHKLIATIILTIEKFLEDEEFQVYGLTVVQDMARLGFSSAMAMASNSRTFLGIMQEAMPIRLKSLNVVNEPLIFDAIYKVASRFMKDNVKKRLKLHGTNFRTLHEKIDPKYLPSSLGGSGSDLDVDRWREELLHPQGEGKETSV